ILSEAGGQGFKKLPGKRRKPPSIEVRHPSATAPVRDILSLGADQEFGAEVFRYYSAVAHASEHGLTASIDRRTAKASPATGNPLVALVTNSNSVHLVLSAGALRARKRTTHS